MTVMEPPGGPSEIDRPRFAVALERDEVLLTLGGLGVACCLAVVLCRFALLGRSAVADFASVGYRRHVRRRCGAIAAKKQCLQCRDHQEQDDRTDEHAAHYDSGQWTLHLASNPR